LPTGQEDHAGRLVFHKAADQSALFFRELLFPDSDIAEHDDIELREFLQGFGKFLDVIRAAAGDCMPGVFWCRFVAWACFGRRVFCVFVLSVFFCSAKRWAASASLRPMTPII
jgi:hypothetical protein